MKRKPDKSIIVETKVGKIKGQIENNSFIWRGIPYAKPPVGKLRFKRAIYNENLEGTYNADCFGDSCMQTRKRSACNENSLTLNIWSQSVDTKKPVIFFIHGGSFVDGSGSDLEYEGSSLIKEGAVVVTINYRLGVLGMSDFSFLGDRFDTNCGLSDIICALKWVKNNIKSFGGDPDNITVMGQSAGAIAIMALICIPQAQKYISKAIMMSGSPTLMHTKNQCEHLSQKFMQFSGIDNAEDLINADAESLISYQPSFAKYCGLGEGTFSIEIDDDYLTEYPIQAIQKGKGENIPILLGSTREEMSFLFIKPFNKRFDIGGIFQAGVEGEDPNETRKIDEAYNIYGKRKNAIMMADLVFRMPTVWFAEEYSKNAPTWMYRFDYESLIMKLTKLYSFHSTDLPMIFNNTNAGLYRYIYPIGKYVPSFQRVSNEMKKDFIQFIYSGKLDWEKCSGTYTPAKCYNRQIKIEPVVDKSIKDAYLNCNFYKRSMRGESNNLN